MTTKKEKQGCVISPLLFFVLINIFENIPGDMGRSLFVGDGALQKKGRNLDHVVRKIQEEITSVESWGSKWGFKFSV